MNESHPTSLAIRKETKEAAYGILEWEGREKAKGWEEEICWCVGYFI